MMRYSYWRWIFLGVVLASVVTTFARGAEGPKAGHDESPSRQAAATPSPKKEIRLESLGVKSKPMATPTDAPGKPLAVPDFSLVHKAPAKKSKSRVSMTCSSRDGRIFKPEDVGFENCMRNASQEPGRGENIVHPAVPGVEFQHHINGGD
jgi:hypothetical protein